LKTQSGFQQPYHLATMCPSAGFCWLRVSDGLVFAIKASGNLISPLN